MLERLHAAIDSQEASWTETYRFRRHDHSFAQTLHRAGIVRDAAGRALRMVGAMCDVSLRRELQALQETLDADRAFLPLTNEAHAAHGGASRVLRFVSSRSTP